MAKKNTKEELTQKFTELAASRDHTIVEMVVTNLKETILKILCNKCNTEFPTNGFNYTRAGGKKTEANFVSEEKGHVFPYGCPTCKTTYKKQLIARPRGDKHHNWKGGVDDVSKRDGFVQAAYNTWREVIFTVYNGACFLTGNTVREELEAHHLNSWGTSPEGRYDPKNGVLLHKTVHREFHSMVGHATTVLQFEQFASQKHGITSFPWSTGDVDFEKIQQKLLSLKDERLDAMKAKVDAAGLTLISFDYENKKSELVLSCPKHGQTFSVTVSNFKRNKYGAPCCSREVSNKNTPPSQKGLKRSAETLAKKSATTRNKTYSQLEAKVAQYPHKIVSGTYENFQSLFTFYCEVHETHHTISYMNYMRNKNGMPCCSDNPRNKKP